MRNVLGLACVGLLSLVVAKAASAEIVSINEIDHRVTRWNEFVEQLLSLHERQLSGRKVRVEERVGSYHRLPNFYRELRYYDQSAKRLLSVLQWERERPERLHSIEVYVYGPDGRLQRDYGATFLPDGRNAPIQTYINLHRYPAGLHSFRQFNASDERIYEDCRGRHRGDRVWISIGEYDLPDEDQVARNQGLDRHYRVCFDGLATSAGKFLNPQ